MRKNNHLIDAPLPKLSKGNNQRALGNRPLSISSELRNQLLRDVLPYDSNTKSGDRLIAGIKEYDFLLTAAEASMELLRANHIASFDPLVGENACQIRAIKNCLIFSSYPVKSDDLLPKIRLAKKK